MLELVEIDRMQDSRIYVNGMPVEPQEVINYLKYELSLKEFCHKVLYQQIISGTAQERGIVVSSEEIQAEADRVRHELHLEKASDTINWLSGNILTADEWEVSIRDRLLSQKLKEALFSQDVESFFIQNRLDFDRVILYQIIVPYEQVAHELFYQIEESEISFFEAAHLYDLDPNRRYRCGYEGTVYRWSLEPAVAAVIFAANPGQIVHPIQTAQGFHLFLVEEFIPTHLTSDIRQEILQRLFQEWLTGELNYLSQ